MVAKVKTQKSNKVVGSIFKKGSLVIDESDGEILIVTEEDAGSDNSSFRGTLLDPGEAGDDVGEYMDYYPKHRFTKFVGSITLTQE